MIEFLFLDLDDTILDFHKAERVAVSKTFREFGIEPTEELKKEIQKYVKEHTAPYKYPRIVVFRDSLPKTISGKIQRNKL